MAEMTAKEISEACEAADRAWMMDRLFNDSTWHTIGKETCYHLGFDAGFKEAVRWMLGHKTPAESFDTNAVRRAMTTVAHMIRDAARRAVDSRLQVDDEAFDGLVRLFNLPDEQMYEAVLARIDDHV